MSGNYAILKQEDMNTKVVYSTFKLKEIKQWRKT